MNGAVPNPILVMIPTYNERENVEKLFHELDKLPIGLDFLFVDDNSPDGTGQVLEEVAQSDPRVHVVHRPGKLGVGSAHADGIHWAYREGYETLITMDCDFTHRPSYVLDLLDNADGADVVVGSRYMGRKSLAGWNVLRRTLTHTGHFLTKNLLSVPYDATGALRLYDLKRVPEHAFDLVSSNGYSFFFESLHLLHRNGYRIREIPIDLPPRTYGHSKMDMSEVLKSVRLLLATISNRLFNPEMFVVVEPMSESEIEEGPTDEQAWDEYWKTDNYSGRVLYNVIAAFYRKVIIRPSLNRFVRQHFEPGATVLHAGSGGGQVDPDVRRYVNVIALDISPKALEFYRQVNGPESETLLGSIFDMPLEAGSVDGIYNLGVMEHFAEEEIGQILEDFRRVLKDDGKLLIFWPPEFGLSVTFFKGLTFLLKNVLRRENPQLHPDEITRLRSRRHAEAVFGAAGFSMLEYHFGFRDAFTYVVVVAVKR